MWLMFDGDENDPEIECSGSPEELQELGRKLVGFTEQIAISFDRKQSLFYKNSLKEALFTHTPYEDAHFSVKIRGKTLELTGGTNVCKILGQSLIDFFSENVTPDDHFQIDQFDGNIISEDSKCTLIFCVSRMNNG
ncbi:hypothetical protein [Paremcibacter congregatus]|uniref:Uncharacterized protein n=1 Tax=Paremcibacter congregatus TaxID=2043170 RepID=A0A2G4YVL5_9PROT|nr:hypothetical protein [Paremcibacter congregatus]PHZ86392.1 hypothetical protein CRD36_00435 [Paremcibacter congregatus]QDE28511.1 hypothetical protein FIV45_15145 [Paremcibacter congregatus]